MVSDLRYGWKKLRKLATEVSDNLTRLQVGFKRELIKEVKAFVVDAQVGAFLGWMLDGGRGCRRWLPGGVLASGPSVWTGVS